MNNRCFYRSERKNAEVEFYLIELVLFALFAERAIAGEWKPAIVPAAFAAAFAVFRRVKGPLIGPALIEVTDSELIWRLTNHFPVKLWKKPLESIKTVKVAGPKGDRRFRIVLADDAEEELRPYFGRNLELKAVHFLRNSLPKTIAVIEEDPPSVFSQIRGDF